MAALGSNMKGRSSKPKEAAKEVKKAKATPTKKKAAKPKKKPVVAAKEVKEAKQPVQAVKAPDSPKPKAEKKPKHSLKKATLVIEPSKRKKIRKTRVFLEGNLSIINIEAFIELIHPIFNEYDYVDFYLRNVTALDLSFIQMLYHMQSSYAKNSKEVTIDSELTKELKTIIVQAGFEELMFIPKLV